MKVFADRLRERASELGISNAEAARRAGLAERRYGNYITGEREPDLATLVRISEALRTTPDYLLGASGKPERGQRERLLDRLMSAAAALRTPQLMTVVTQTEALAAENSKEIP